MVVAFVARAPALATVISDGSAAANYRAAVTAAAAMTIVKFDPLPEFIDDSIDRFTIDLL